MEKTMKIIMEKPFVVEMMKYELKSTNVTLIVKRQRMKKLEKVVLHLI
jgi:hypothetical protein